MYNLSSSSDIIGKKWNSTKEADPCKWKGVTCNQNYTSIAKLSLSGLSLSDSADVFPNVCKIDSLQELDVSSNQLGSIPDVFFSACGLISDLKKLNFSKNGLVGFACFTLKTSMGEAEERE